MRIASYNVENMFRRPVAFDPHDWDKGRPVLEAYAELQHLFEKLVYSETDKKRILELLDTLRLRKSDRSEWAALRKPRGHLLARHRDGSVEVIADGRGDWIGWLELVREAVDEVGTHNTAAVIRDVDADALAVVEAEDRPALQRFNLDVLRLDPDDEWGDSWAKGYTHVMLIDGNDERGIDVGLLTRDEYPIERMRSHVDDGRWDQPIFSRDCAEYELAVPAGPSLLLMVNHFKSKGYGERGESDARRKRQAERVAEIYAQRRSEGWERIVVSGDLNDTPQSAPLAPLLAETDLRDASEHASFDFGERRGTYATGNDKIDYLLLSPELLSAVSAGGVNRKGVWRGPRVRDPWEMLPTLTKETEAASDHAAIWVDLDI